MTLLKKRFWHKCLPVNFAKFLRTPFLQNKSTSGRLLLSPYREKLTPLANTCIRSATTLHRNIFIDNINKQLHSVQPPPLPPWPFLLEDGGGGVKLPTKFSKRGFRGSQFWEGVAGKEGVTFFRGLQFCHKRIN